MTRWGGLFAAFGSAFFSLSTLWAYHLPAMPDVDQAVLALGTSASFRGGSAVSLTQPDTIANENTDSGIPNSATEEDLTDTVSATEPLRPAVEMRHRSRRAFSRSSGAVPPPALITEPGSPAILETQSAPAIQPTSSGQMPVVAPPPIFGASSSPGSAEKSVTAPGSRVVR